MLFVGRRLGLLFMLGRVIRSLRWLNEKFFEFFWLSAFGWLTASLVEGDFVARVGGRVMFWECL